ncbi:MAG: hypothetical protein MUF24_09555 [Chitinophagaceae bacterium]|jgi:hypothetical protein|nr:hypothetical protein [Chitinophagaceae bacterium]
MNQLPESYEAWRHCIEVDCGQPLTKAFIQQRLSALSNANDAHTAAFAAKYGADYLKQVVQWFQQALALIRS